MNQPALKYHEAILGFKRKFLAETLMAHGGNRTRTARALGLQRTYLLRLIREFRVDVPPQQRAGGPQAERVTATQHQCATTSRSAQSR